MDLKTEVERARSDATYIAREIHAESSADMSSEDVKLRERSASSNSID